MHVKQGGSGVVKIKDGIATKTLRKRSTKEKRERFAQEVEIVKSLPTNKPITNVIEILEVRMDENPPWYSMREYAGDSSDLLSFTSGEVEKTANLLIPIVSTLKTLSELDEPIYHRDLKPDNLLYETSGEEKRLILADFGCAYLKTDKDERLTQDFRAVGAMAYRAPEYHHGRVDEVDEKGDIFSIGKLLWFFINGVCHEVFPYTLWFPNEYDLANRFPSIPDIEKVNLLIASTVHHDPKSRIGYEELLASLDGLSRTTPITKEQSDAVRMERYEALLKLKIEETYAITSNLIDVFQNDVRFALTVLTENLPKSETIKDLREHYGLRYPLSATLQTIVKKHSDCPLWNHDLPNMRINSRIFPPRRGATGIGSDMGKSFPYIILKCSVQDSTRVSRSYEIGWCYDPDSGLRQHHKGTLVPHDKGIAYELFSVAFAHLTS